ncbi:uncharacterized protein LOC135346619 [Halichondria panicea]|uniref:uncharacterized protein LOC135346619 n=1 Tax=Halichondria panicea TaxID=6063 RepID=UPI00312B42CA
MRLTRLLLASLEGLKPLCIDQNFSVFKRTVDHLQSWQLELPGSVKKATCHLCLDTTQSAQRGAWMFLYENVPQLKYHNPSIVFSVQRHNEEDSKIEFVSENGDAEILLMTGLKQAEIREQLESLVNRL